MSKTCYIHVGFPKTATTSLQATFAENTKLLHELDITYPIFKVNNKKGIAKKHSNHSMPISVIFQKEQKLAKKEAKSYHRIDLKEAKDSCKNQLVNYLANSNNLFISGENICFMSQQELSDFVEKIHKYNYEVKAIALIRNPYTATCSSIQEKIKSGRYINLISLNDKVPKSCHNIKQWSKANVIRKLKPILASRIKFIPFEQACSNPYGPVGFIIKEFLNQDPSAFKYVKKNESMYNLSVRVCNEMNKYDSAFTNGKFNKDHKRFPMAVDKELDFSGKFLLTEAEFNVISDFIKKEEGEIENLLGIKYDQSTLRFSEPIYK